MVEEKIIILLLLIFSFLGFLVSAYFLFSKKILMPWTMGIMFFSSSVATFVYAFQISAPHLTAMFMWVVVRYIALLVFALTFVLFVFNFTQTPITVTSPKFFLLAIIPASILVYLALNPNSARLYNQNRTLTYQEILLIDRWVAPAFIILQAYVVGLLLSLFFLLFKGLKQKTKLDRINTAIIASGLFIYVSTHLIQLSGIRLLGSYSINMFTYFPTALFAVWGVQRYRLADIRPIAYSSVFKQMREAILVIDHKGYLVDCNPVAKELFAHSSHMSLGKIFNLEDLDLPGFPINEKNARFSDRRIDIRGVPYQARNSALYDRHGRLYGHLVIFQDVSGQVEAENLRIKNFERKAVWVERNNVARTLHDSIMQDMNSLFILTNAAQERLRQGKVAQLMPVLESIIECVKFTSSEVKDLTRELRVGADENGFSLVQSLAKRVEFIDDHCSARISLEQPCALCMPIRPQREFFYIILEALNNAVKHAAAHQITITLVENSGTAQADVVDDGIGFSPAHAALAGMGLVNMRQRASQIGADLEIDSAPGAGTRVRVALDWRKGIE